VTRPLFDQYKDALRRGHLAARSQRLDEALAAYAEAARLAPDRAAPHASSATVLHQAGRDTDALAAFERALAIAPDDETTLRARVAVFRDMRRLASAAGDLERLAEALDAAGRGTEALAAAREAVALTATADRRVLVARLEAAEAETPRRRPSPVEQAAAAAARQAPAPKPASQPPAAASPSAVPDEAFAARLAAVPDEIDEVASAEPQSPAEPTSSTDSTPIAPAAEPPASPPPVTPSSTLLDLYDEPIADAPAIMQPVPGSASAAPTNGATEDAAPAVASAAAEVLATDAPPKPKAPIGFTGSGDLPAVADEWSAPAKRSSFDLAGGLQSEALVILEEDDPSAAIPWPAIDLPSAPPPPIVGPPPDPEALMAEAHELIDAGNAKDARNLMLTAVMVHRAAGRPDAAIDVCLQLLALAPGDAHVHLAIAGLQLDRGWRTLATDKIGLLLRLTALTGDTQAEADAHALAAERLRDEQPSSFARA